MTQWIQQAVRRAPFRDRREIFWLTVLAMFMAIVIGALYLSNVAETSTIGRQLEVLIEEQERLEQENEELRIEIAELRSVPRLLARAEALGFRQAVSSEVEYLIVAGYSPQRERTVAPIRDEDAEPIPVYDETLIGWLRQQVDTLGRQFAQFNAQ
ncbi:MAG: hypothetical protein ACOYL5_08845 [Phototrophicaceae bacterium]|jgi:cell division protein FtsL